MNGAAAGRDAVRLAMWSGPRNISTAMMRAWENRPDTTVVDEPFYAAYLAASGADHPMREAVLAAQSSDWDEVVRQITGPVPGGRRIFYQKHMTHHMLPQAPVDWLDQVTSAFLIRHPVEVARSYAAARRIPELAELGFVRQAELFDRVADRLGAAPPVVDAADVLADPAAALAGLCEAVGVDFDARMLSWPPGPRPTDGAWAPHWYGAVWKSTGFSHRASRTPPLDARTEAAITPVVEAAMPYYERLARHRLAYPDAARPGALRR